MIRFILAAIWVIFFLIVSIPFILIEFVVKLFSKKAAAKSSQVIVCAAFKVVSFIAGTKIICIGKEKIPENTPVLFVPNHRSIFDIILTYPLCPGQTGYVAKKETGMFPVFNVWMYLMNCQFLDRKDLRKGLKVILKCADTIKAGSSVCIFPEGTRNKGNEPLLPFHDGSLKIAEKTKCPIVPVTINNSEKIFEAQLPKIRKATVVIEYGDPIDTSSLSRGEMKEISVKLQDIIIETYLKNQALIK